MQENLNLDLYLGNGIVLKKESKTYTLVNISEVIDEIYISKEASFMNVKSGSIKIYYQEGARVYHENELIFLEPSVLIRMVRVSSKIEISLFTSELISVMNSNINFGDLKSFSETMTSKDLFEELVERVSELERDLRANEIKGKIASSFAFQLIESMDSSNIIKRNTQKHTIRDVVFSIVLECHLNKHEDFSLKSFAQQFGVSIYYLSRMFRVVLGKSYLEINRLIRLSSAIGYISQTKFSFTNIALISGYRNVKQLNRDIRACFDKPPSFFRGIRTNSSSSKSIALRDEHFLGNIDESFVDSKIIYSYNDKIFSIDIDGFDE